MHNRLNATYTSTFFSQLPEWSTSGWVIMTSATLLVPCLQPQTDCPPSKATSKLQLHWIKFLFVPRTGKEERKQSLSTSAISHTVGTAVMGSSTSQLYFIGSWHDTAIVYVNRRHVDVFLKQLTVRKSWLHRFWMATGNQDPKHKPWVESDDENRCPLPPHVRCTAASLSSLGRRKPMQRSNQTKGRSPRPW